MPSFTPQQLSAIEAPQKDLLLSAAAGSGKTTVLVARVLHLLEQGMDIDRILIVTFTRAAAADMREKLQRRLEEMAGQSKRLREQLDRLPYAAIGTIHSFCSSLIRERFEAAGVDPAFRIMETAEADKMQSEALQEAMDEIYAQGGEGLEWLTCGRDARAVADLAASLYRFVRNRPDPWRWLDEAIARCTDKEFIERCTQILEDDAKAFLRDALALYGDAHEICMLQDGPIHYAAAIEKDMELLGNALSLHADELRDALTFFTQARPGRGKCDENLLSQAQDLRKNARTLVGKTEAALVDREHAAGDMRMSVPAMRTLCAIVRSMHKRLEAEKDARSAYDYADLEQRALRAMNDPQIEKAVSGRYDAVFVDEYQDVSDMQEALIRKTARPGRLFMVGDVKQSIYRFRLAEPGLFLKKQRLFSAPDEADGELILLNRNFRSRARILDFTNRVFDRAMRASGSEINYTADEYLYPGAQWPDEDPPIEVALMPCKTADIDRDEDDSADVTTREAMFIAKRIHELVGTPVYDPALKETRPLRYRDIVVLGRTRSRLLALRDILEMEGLPCFADTGGGYAETMEIRHALALLSLVSNARRDADMLAALLSPCFGFTPEDIAQIRIVRPKGAFCDAAAFCAQEEGELARRLRDFFASLAKWRLLSRNLPLDAFLDRFLRETGFADYVSALAGGERRRSNLELLCDMAARYAENHTGGLSGFLESFKMPSGGAADYGEAQPLGEGDDVVRLMTAHKSKGLEFPVVFGVQMERDFTRRSVRGELCAHRDLGFGMELHDPRLGTRREPILCKAVKSTENLETINEEMRLLYVLMTRASDRLILVGRADVDEPLWRWKGACADVRRIHTWLDLIAPCVPGLGTQQSDPNIVLHTQAPGGQPGALHPAQEGVSPTAALDELLSSADEAPQDLLKAYSWVYPHASETLAPLKMTVSSLARQVIGPAERTAPEELPEFLGGASRRALSRGTATHAALCALDLSALKGVAAENLRVAVDEQLDSLAQRGLFDAQERAAIYPDMLVRFLKSGIGRRMMHADVLRREWPFNLRMNAREAIGPDSPDTDVLVQGVIDCCFMEDGAWVLLDYKTDRVDDREELLARYSPQLLLYRRALAEITGIPVRESRLCLLRTGESLAVE